MDRADTWRCADYFLQCCWYLNAIVRPTECGEVSVIRNGEKVLTCTLIKKANGLKCLTTWFKENDELNTSQLRSNTYTAHKWNLVLSGEKKIGWYDQGWTDFELQGPVDGDVVRRSVPTRANYRIHDFAKESYSFLVSAAIKSGETGCITTHIENHMLLTVEINKCNTRQLWGPTVYNR
jgi:hypothetical protein